MSIAKTGKKFIGLIALFVFGFILTGCTLSEKETNLQTAKQHAEEVYANIIWDDSAREAITSNLKLTETSKYADVKIAWQSSEEDIISTTGKVTRPSVDDARVTEVKEQKVVKVTLTAIITASYSYTDESGSVQNDKYSVTKTFNFTVLCLDADMHVGTIKEVKDAAANYIYKEMGVEQGPVSNANVVYSVGFVGVVTATLMADGAGQFMVHDGTEGIYVFSNQQNPQIGDTVRVYGNIYSYYGSLQVGSNITVEKIADQGITLPEHTKISVQEWHDTAVYDGYLGGKLLSIYAKLVNEKSATNSDEFKLVDPFTGEVAWIYYKSYNEDLKQELLALSGKYVNIKGVSYDKDSRSTKNHLLFNGGIEEAEAPTLTDEQKMDLVKAELSALAKDYLSGSKLMLPVASVANNATISWVISEGAPYTLATGVFNIVDKDTEMTATATIQVGALTETLEVKMTVKKIVTCSIQEAINAGKGATVQLEGTVEAIFNTSKKYFYLKDETGTLLMYFDASQQAGLVNGAKVTLIGEVNVFNGTPQIGKVIQWVSVGEGTWEQSRPTEVTIDQLLAYTIDNAPYGKYLAVRGLLTKDASNYFYLTDPTDASKSISLYYSFVDAEKLTAVVGTTTEVTLFVYYYGNAKADFTGVTRVIFAQRAGEYFVGDEEVIMPEQKDYITVAAAKALATATGVDVTVQAVITAKGVYSESFNNFPILLQDETGAIYGYRVASKAAYDKINVGDLVRVSGKATSFNGLLQITGITNETIQVIESGKTVANTSIDGVAPADLLPHQNKIVTLTDVQYVSGDYAGGKVTVTDGINQYLIFLSKSDWNVAALEAIIAGLKVGQKLTVTGWLNWYNGGQITPLNGSAIVPGAAASPEEEAQLVLDAIKLAEQVTADFDLPSDAVWSIVSGSVIVIENGVAKITRPAIGAADETVVLKATIMVGETAITKDFTVVVKALEDVTGEVAVEWGAAVSGYVANKELTVKVGDVDTKIIAHWSQTATSTFAPHMSGKVFGVLCPVRKGNTTKDSYFEFSFASAVSNVSFDATWWSPADSNNASKITKMEAQYFNGTTWVSLGSFASLDASKYTNFAFAGFSATKVRIYVEGDQANYGANQNARIAVDNIKFR